MGVSQYNIFKCTMSVITRTLSIRQRFYRVPPIYLLYKQFNNNNNNNNNNINDKITIEFLGETRNNNNNNNNTNNDNQRWYPSRQ